MLKNSTGVNICPSTATQWNGSFRHFKRPLRWMRLSILLIASLCFYGCLSQQNPAVETLTETVAGEESCRIVFIADLHLTAKSFDEKKIVLFPGIVNALQPDWVLFGGDTFDGLAKTEKELFSPRFAAWLKQISPRSGIVIVTGDHDAQLSEPGWLLSPDIRLLENDSIKLTGKITLWGSSCPGWKNERIPEKLKNVIAAAAPDEVILCVAHLPEFYDFLPDDPRILVLSGDTHGGLIHIWGIPDGYFTELFGYHFKYVRNWYGDKGGKRLFVSSGVGGQGIRGMRIGMAPQIVLLVFQRN